MMNASAFLAFKTKKRLTVINPALFIVNKFKRNGLPFV